MTIGNPYHDKKDGRFAHAPSPGSKEWHDRVQSILPNTTDKIGVPAGLNTRIFQRGLTSLFGCGHTWSMSNDNESTPVTVASTKCRQFGTAPEWTEPEKEDDTDASD